MIKKVVSDLKIRYYILVIPLPEKGVNLSLRFKKYVYVTLMTSAMWLLLLYFIVPSTLTIVASIVYLIFVIGAYSDVTAFTKVEIECGFGLLSNYLCLLFMLHIFVSRLIFNLDWISVTKGVLITLVLFTVASLATMCKIQRDSNSWIFFSFRSFGIKVDEGFLVYSEDKQDWGVYYGIYLLLYSLISIFVILYFKLGKKVFELSITDLMPLTLIGFILIIVSTIMYGILYKVEKDKYKRLHYFNSVFLFSIIATFSIAIQSLSFMWISLSVSLVNLIVYISFRDSIKEDVLTNIFYATVYPDFLIVSLNIILYKFTGIPRDMLVGIGIVTLGVFFILVYGFNINLFNIDEAFGYRIDTLDKVMDVDVNTKLFYRVYPLKLITISLIYFAWYCVYVLVTHTVQVQLKLHEIAFILIGLAVFITIVIKTFVTLSKKEEE